MTLETDWSGMLPLYATRVMLRRFRSSDLAPFLAYRNDPEVARFQGWESLTSRQARAFIAQQKTRKAGKPGHWLQIAIAFREDGCLIGDCALKIHSDDNRQATIGITLSRRCQGQGLAAEALVILLNHLFVRMKLHRVQADTDPENTAAWSLLERLGMRRESHSRQSLWFKGRWADEFVYAILGEEWLSR
jgi:RimJ/RimL family protein N-acetyltransferase